MGDAWLGKPRNFPEHNLKQINVLVNNTCVQYFSIKQVD